MLGAGASSWPDEAVRGETTSSTRTGQRPWRRAVPRSRRPGSIAGLPGRHPDGTTVWVRDVVHVVRGAQGPRELQGLMVDITERKRLNQALRTSRRKYSEAFRREREATQRLRNLDEMKNTFLEAVSHDLVPLSRRSSGRP